MVALPDELVIVVTAEDIELGKPNHAHQCAIAHAVCRLPGIEAAEVRTRKLLAQYRREDGISSICSYVLPAQANDFIDAFDDGDKVEPITFTATKREDW